MVFVFGLVVGTTVSPWLYFICALPLWREFWAFAMLATCSPILYVQKRRRLKRRKVRRPL